MSLQLMAGLIFLFWGVEHVNSFFENIDNLMDTYDG